MNLMEKWKEIVNSANQSGVPLPMVRVDGKASLTATLTWISFNIWVISVIGKAAGALGGMDSGACLHMFITCQGLYLGRRFQSDGKTTKMSEQDPKNSDES